MKTITSQLQDAITQLKAGTFTGNVTQLLEQVAKRFEEREAREEQVRLANTKNVYEAYREMHERLQEIGRQFCEARIPSAKVIYLTKWSYHDGGNNGNEVLNLDLEYRRTEVEDGEDADRPDGYDGFGQGYVSRMFNVYVKPEWLWDEDALKSEIRIAGIEAELERTQKRAADLEAAIPKRENDVEETRTRWQQSVAHANDLIERIARIKEGE